MPVWAAEAITCHDIEMMSADCAYVSALTTSRDALATSYSYPFLGCLSPLRSLRDDLSTCLLADYCFTAVTALQDHAMHMVLSHPAAAHADTIDVISSRSSTSRGDKSKSSPTTRVRPNSVPKIQVSLVGPQETLRGRGAGAILLPSRSCTVMGCFAFQGPRITLRGFPTLPWAYQGFPKHARP
ncbi:uncharacterized protein BO80DRAFT_14448 [Aspergillus ibericus CBS 121593]|uniref:Uncharacterized protein n=1 Tax=Aspergillus ibericus CBS 121593 TaxID=1448316 RepID=A0A395H696_9EURO|nr:hypothetical protein BO80DRAFT_14448 [Aspergillus ibericus CBS 121593]RAL03150.1 hypothetical protein BO80DRAFT_14448 [Aspergillus ibericus CBS 121593]